MAHLHKAFYRLAAHPESRGIRIFEFRMFLFKPDKLLVHPVIFGVRYDGSRLHVIKTVVAVDFRNQIIHSRLDIAHLTGPLSHEAESASSLADEITRSALERSASPP